MGDASDVVVAIEGAAADLLTAVGDADPVWLGLGVVLHVANQLARALGWYAILAGACDPHVRPSTPWPTPTPSSRSSPTSV